MSLPEIWGIDKHHSQPNSQGGTFYRTSDLVSATNSWHEKKEGRMLNHKTQHTYQTQKHYLDTHSSELTAKRHLRYNQGNLNVN